MRFLMVFAVLVWVGLGSWGSGAQAQQEVTADPAIENVISDQIEAFRQDDFSRAFQFASPDLQRMFGTPDRFGAMVRQGYPMVWRPGDVRFGALRDVEGVLWQEVLVTDTAGQRFGLAYRMERFPDGWRIAAVQVIPAPDVAV